MIWSNHKISGISSENIDSGTDSFDSYKIDSYISSDDQISKNYIHWKNRMEREKRNDFLIWFRELKKVKDQIDIVDQKNIKLSEQLNLQTKELNKDKSSLITILWIFVAFFTFVSMEIDVLKKVPDFKGVAWFSLLFVCLLVIFVFMIDFVAWRWRNSKTETVNGWNRFWNRIKSISSYFRVWSLLIIMFWIRWANWISQSQSTFDSKIHDIEITWFNMQSTLELIEKDIQELKEENIWLDSKVDLLEKENNIILQIKNTAKK